MLSTIRKVLDLFEARERWELAGLFGLILVLAIIQSIGVASILPFMALVANPDVIIENRWLQWLYLYLGFDSTRAFLVFVGLVVLGINALSNILSAATHWLMVSFIWRKQYHLSVRLLSRYVHEPYAFFLNRNTSDLAKNIFAEVRDAINGVVMPVMKMLTQVVVAVCMFVLLLLVDFVLALASIGVLGGAYAAVYALVRRKQGKLGRIRRAANGLRFQAAGEALGGIKEAKALGREREFLKRFSAPARLYSSANASNATISEIPRYALETLAFGGILLAVLYIISTQPDFGKAVAVMSLYALAGYRLMPAFQQIFHGLTKARFFAPALGGLHEDLVGSKSSIRHLVTTPEQLFDRVSFERDIIIDDVMFRYPGSHEPATNNVTFRIPKNTIVGICGSTGSGKSTMVDILLGLIEPQQGCIRLDGVPLSQRSYAGWRRNLGYVPQHIYLCDDTFTRNIAFGLPDDEIDQVAVERAARIAQLHEFIMTLPKAYNTVVGERGVRLSGGQRQRVGIARALYHNPQVLIMDEATSALDGITEDAVMRAIETLAGTKTIILVAHRLSTLRGCHNVFLFHNGTVVDSGNFTELLATNSHFREMAQRGDLEAVSA